jgi:hypothetical protein
VRTSRIVGEDPPELRNGPDQNIFANKHIGPNSISEVVPWHDLSRFGGQLAEHQHHLWLEMDRLSVTLHRVDVRVHNPIADAEIISQCIVPVEGL